jgi:hypothetical protein
VVEDLEKLRERLRAMPVPEPRPGFVDRVLAIATAGRPRPEARGIRGALSRPLTWWAACIGAATASAAWIVVMTLYGHAPQVPRVMLALNESREISLVIDSERALEGATIRLHVTGGVALAGYEGQQEIQWLTSLNQGANLLSLPVIGRAPGDGSVVAEIEHEGRTRRVSVTMHVSTLPLTTMAPVRG